MHRSAATTDCEATHIANVQKAHRLRKKAQQLAKDELGVLNQAVELNLLSKQLAEATMRPNVVHNPTSMPFYISLPAGMNNPAFRMQLMRAQQAALGGQHMNLNGSSQADALKAAAAAPAAAGNLSPVLPAAGNTAASVSSADMAAAAAGNEAVQSAAEQNTVQAASEALQQPFVEQLPQQQSMAAAAAPTWTLRQVTAQQSGVQSLHDVGNVQQAASPGVAGAEQPQTGDQGTNTGY